MKNELFTLQPNLKQWYGRTITKETEFDECTNPPEGITRKVHQTLKDLVLTTEIEDNNEVEGIKIEHTEKTTETLPEGTILIWSEMDGYVLPQYRFYKLDDLKKEIKEIENIYKKGE